MKQRIPAIYTILLIALTLVFQQCRLIRPGQIPISDTKNIIKNVIPLDSAIFYTSNFTTGVEDLKAQLRDTAFLSQSFNLPRAELFNRDVMASLLNVPGAQGIRIYLGRTEDGLINLVLMPTDKESNDIIAQLLPTPPATGPAASTRRFGNQQQATGQAMENGQRCPTVCSANSPLN